MIATHNTDRQPGDAEADAAIAAMRETYGYRPAPGDRVACERPFRGDYVQGVVIENRGAYVVVQIATEETPETLHYYAHELRKI